MDIVERLTQDLQKASELIKALQVVIQENTLSQAQFKSGIGVRLETVLDQIKCLQDVVYGEGSNDGLSQRVVRLQDSLDALKGEVGGKVGPMKNKQAELRKSHDDLGADFKKHLESLATDAKESKEHKREDERFEKGQRNLYVVAVLAASFPGLVAFVAWLWKLLLSSGT